VTWGSCWPCNSRGGRSCRARSQSRRPPSWGYRVGAYRACRQAPRCQTRPFPGGTVDRLDQADPVADAEKSVDVSKRDGRGAGLARVPSAQRVRGSSNQRVKRREFRGLTYFWGTHPPRRAGDSTDHVSAVLAREVTNEASRRGAGQRGCAAVRRIRHVLQTPSRAPQVRLAFGCYRTLPRSFSRGISHRIL
jgi:hypothetical protein